MGRVLALSKVSLPTYKMFVSRGTVTDSPRGWVVGPRRRSPFGVYRSRQVSGVDSPLRRREWTAHCDGSTRGSGPGPVRGRGPEGKGHRGHSGSVPLPRAPVEVSVVPSVDRDGRGAGGRRRADPEAYSPKVSAVGLFGVEREPPGRLGPRVGGGSHWVSGRGTRGHRDKGSAPETPVGGPPRDDAGQTGPGVVEVETDLPTYLLCILGLS